MNFTYSLAATCTNIKMASTYTGCIHTLTIFKVQATFCLNPSKHGAIYNEEQRQTFSVCYFTHDSVFQTELLQAYSPKVITMGTAVVSYGNSVTDTRDRFKMRLKKTEYLWDISIVILLFTRNKQTTDSQRQSYNYTLSLKKKKDSCRVRNISCKYLDEMTYKQYTLIWLNHSHYSPSSELENFKSHAYQVSVISIIRWL